MSKLRDNLLPVFDKVARGIPNKLGLRQYDVSLRTISWSGSRPGVGTKTITDVHFSVNQGKAGNDRPKVTLVSTREIVASGGRYTEGDFRIGPMTPQYTDSQGRTFGTTPDDFQLAIKNSPTEIFFNLKGPGMSDQVGGDWFELVETDFTKNFGYTIVVRKTGIVS